MPETSVVHLLKRLVQTESPYFHEQAVMDLAASWLEERGVPVTRHKYYAQICDFHGENLCGTITGGREGPHIHLNGHLDTVNLCAGWTREPFAANIEGDLLYGVGALDMKGGAAVMMETLARLAARKDELCGTVSYSLVSDEEGPYGLGTTFLLRDGMIGRPDGVISCEPAGAFAAIGGAAVGLGARGGVSFTVKLYGKAAHAGEPDKGVSAVDDGARAILALNSIAPNVDEKLGRGETCVLRVSGGGEACSVPDHCELEVFRHIVRGETRETVRKQTDAAFKAAGLRCRWEIVFRPEPAPGFDGGFLPYAVPEDHELAHRLMLAAELVWGAPPAVAYMVSIGDFNLLGGNAGIPTVMFGPGGGGHHGADEHVRLSDVEKCCDTLMKLFLK